MDFNGMCKTTIYSLLLTMAMALLPCASSAAPQHSDINKPTRERVKKDKDTSKKQSQNKKDDNKKDEAKKDNKNTPVKATVKPADKKQAPPQDSKREDKAKEQPKDDNREQDKEPEKKPEAAAPRPVDKNFDGIDVSKYQLNINWEEIKRNPKIQYVYIKATEGCDHTDHRYEDNIRNARKHGVKVGSYHYLTNRSSATAQFQNFIRTARRDEQDLIPFIDVEECSRWNSQQLRDSLKVFADLLEDYYGCKPLIYTSESFFKRHLGRAFKDYPLFIAKYSANAPSIGYNWVMWQYSDKGRIAGITSNVDLSRFNNGYDLSDILYRPGKAKGKPRSSVKDAVDRKEKPTSVDMNSGKAKQAPAPSKRQKEEDKKKADKEKKSQERQKKLAEQEAKRNAEKKAEQERKAKAKEEQVKRDKARQQARQEAEKKEAEAKAKRKAEAQKAREQKAKNEAAKKAASKANNKAASTLTTKMTQAQRNDSIRSARNRGQRTNKSSADND